MTTTPLKLPDNCSEQILLAPARSKMLPYTDRVVMPDGKDGYKTVRQPYRAGTAAREEDVFDRMANQTRRKGGEIVLSALHVGRARDYRMLWERIEAGGVKCSNVFDVSTGAGTGRDFMDLYVRDAERLRTFQTAIGAGTALSPRRQGANTMDRGSRVAITHRMLADQVCLFDNDLSAVLRRFGWAVQGRNRKVLKVALVAILDRMLRV